MRAAVGALCLAGCAVAEAQQAQVAPSPELARQIEQRRAQNNVDPSLLPRFYSVRVITPNRARAGQFYRDVFNGRVSQVFPGEDAVSLPSGINLIINETRPGAPAPSAPTAGFIIQVADLDAVVARVAAAGGVVERPASAAASAFGTRTAQIRDPDGVGIELIQFAPPAR